MKDIWGNKLNIGDEVAFKHPNPRYAYFSTGKIIGFTKLFVKIEVYGKSADDSETCLKEPQEVAKRIN